MVQARQMRPIDRDLHWCKFSIPYAGVQRFRPEMVSPFDAGVRRFRGHCCRIHRISTELEWSQRVPEFGYCRTRVGSVLACGSRQSVAVAVHLRLRRASTSLLTPMASALRRPEPAPEAGGTPKAKHKVKQKPKPARRTPEAEAHAHAQGRKPLHPRAARDARAQESAVPAGRTDHDRARRAGRGRRPELHPSSTELARPTSPCLLSSCGTTSGRPSRRRTEPFGR